MKNLRTIIFAVLIIVVLVEGIRYVNHDKQTPAHNQVASQTIEQYITENISSLSPLPEQLGGKFYITKIDAQGGKGTVSYEDGHNAYTADFMYTIDSSGTPKVDSFIVR